MYMFLITDDFPCAQGEEIEIDMRLTRMFFVELLKSHYLSASFM